MGFCSLLLGPSSSRQKMAARNANNIKGKASQAKQVGDSIIGRIAVVMGIGSNRGIAMEVTTVAVHLGVSGVCPPPPPKVFPLFASFLPCAGPLIGGLAVFSLGGLLNLGRSIRSAGRSHHASWSVCSGWSVVLPSRLLHARFFDRFICFWLFSRLFFLSLRCCCSTSTSNKRFTTMDGKTK